MKLISFFPPCSFRLVLLGAAYFAIVTQNLVAVLAVLLFNIYLVIGGCTCSLFLLLPLDRNETRLTLTRRISLSTVIEAGQRNYLLANDNGPEIATVRRILWAIPAIDIW